MLRRRTPATHRPRMPLEGRLDTRPTALSVRKTTQPALRRSGWITQPSRPDALQVFFTTCENPYRDARELIAAVTELRTLEVTTVAVDPTGVTH